MLLIRETMTQAKNSSIEPAHKLNSTHNQVVLCKIQYKKYRENRSAKSSCGLFLRNLVFLYTGIKKSRHVSCVQERISDFRGDMVAIHVAEYEMLSLSCRG